MSQTPSCNDLSPCVRIVRETKDGKLEPYYTSSTPLKDITFYNNETKKFATKYLCLGDAPFDGYKDDMADYLKCEKGQIKIPFNLLFNHEGGEHYTLDLQ